MNAPVAEQCLCGRVPTIYPNQDRIIIHCCVAVFDDKRYHDGRDMERTLKKWRKKIETLRAEADCGA